MVEAQLLAATLMGAMLGAGAGMGAGLVPGFHANNLAQIALALQAGVVGVLGWAAGTGGGPAQAAYPVCGFLVGAAVGHAFTDEIPAVFLGAPDPDTALSVLPGHRLLMAGQAAVAVRASAAGSAAGASISLGLAVPVAWVMGAPLHAYGALRAVLPVLLIAVAAALCLTEAGRPGTPITRGRACILAAGLLVSSGALGELVMFQGLAWPGAYLFGPLGGGAMHLLSLFAGLFGLPTLLLALLPKDDEADPGLAEGAATPLPGRSHLRAAAVGTGAGALFGWLPGVGAAQAAVLATAAREAAGRRGRRGVPGRDSPEAAAEFLVMQSAAGAANLIFNVVALFALLRTRSGVMAAVETMGEGAVEPWLAPASPPDLLVALLIAAGAVLPLCYAGTRSLGRGAASLYAALDPRHLSAAAFAGIVALIALLEGGAGLAVTAAALPLGLVPPLAGVKRVHLMGAVLVPVALRLSA
jgi:putative membrane protein